MFGRRSSYLLLGAALLTGHLQAALLTYSNTLSGADHTDTYSGIRDLWQGALSSMATVTFDDVSTGFFNGTTLVYDTADNNYFNSTFPTLNATSIQVFRYASGSRSRAVWQGEPPIPGTANRYFAGMAGASSSNYIQITLPTPGTASITGVALDLWTNYSPGQNVTVEVYDSSGALIQTYTMPTNNNSTAAFFGITSDAALGFLRISSTTGDPMLARVDFGLASLNQENPNTETPESATLSYVGIGVAALIFGTNRKLRRAHSAN